MVSLFEVRTHESLSWLVPFIGIDFIAAGLLRPTPEFPVPVPSRTVADAEGTKVQVAIPFRGVALTWPVWPWGYLETTLEPVSLVRAGSSMAQRYFSSDTASWIFLQGEKEDRLWDASTISYDHAPNGEIESLLAFNPSAYLGTGSYVGIVPLLRRVGLPALSLDSPGASEAEGRFWRARAETAIIGHPERGARIIHTRRDPMDTCVSCFSTLFGDGARLFTYELGELGRYYRAYEALMEHWRKVPPEGAMLEVQYEDVVADIKGQTHRVLNYCGLEWDTHSLDLYKTERAVRTASKAQVREPLFKSSVGRWRAYEPCLAPLLEAFAVNERVALS